MRTILKVGYLVFIIAACVLTFILWPEIYTAYNTHLRFRIDNLFSKNHDENNEDDVTSNAKNQDKDTNVVKEVQESSENQNSPNSGT